MSPRLDINANLPIANGICFDDLHGFRDDQVKLLIKRRVVFATEFLDRETGKTYLGTIVAPSRNTAKDIAAKRGLGEKVCGKLWVSVTHG